jgi:hypothetical protein
MAAAAAAIAPAVTTAEVRALVLSKRRLAGLREEQDLQEGRQASDSTARHTTPACQQLARSA